MFRSENLNLIDPFRIAFLLMADSKNVWLCQAERDREKEREREKERD